MGWNFFFKSSRIQLICSTIYIMKMYVATQGANTVDIPEYQTGLYLREKIKCFTYGLENPNNYLIHCVCEEYLVHY